MLINREWKYAPPDIRQLTKGNLTKEMVIILCAEVDESKMEEEDMEY